MNDARDITKYRKEDVDQEIGVAASFEEDAKRWNEDSEDDLANVAIIIFKSVNICSLSGNRKRS